MNIHPRKRCTQRDSRSVERLNSPRYCCQFLMVSSVSPRGSSSYKLTAASHTYTFSLSTKKKRVREREKERDQESVVARMLPTQDNGICLRIQPIN